MSKIKLITDSSVQLTPEEIKKYDITIIPLTISIDGKNYIDGVNITRNDFVKKMNTAKELPKTSQPPIGKFVNAINKLTADGSEIIGIFLSKNLSGTIDAAKQAVSIASKSEKVHIVDSELTDRAEGFQVLRAAEDIQKGKDVPEILADLKEIQKSQFLRMMVVNLKNLIKGGRLGPLSGKVATLLKIRIELQMPGGKLKVAGKGRGKKFTIAFNNRVIKEIEQNKDHIKEVGISYVDTPEIMKELSDRIKAISPKINVLVRETSPIISTHAGHGAYAIMYYTE